MVNGRSLVRDVEEALAFYPHGLSLQRKLHPG